MTNKHLKGLYQQYLKAEDNKNGLYDVYKDFSNAKYCAYLNCVNSEKAHHKKLNGKILSHNSSYFTYGYTFRKNKKNYFTFITAWNTYTLEV